MKKRFGRWLRRLVDSWNTWLEQRTIAKNIHEYERRKIDEDPRESEACKKACKRHARKERDNSRSDS